MTATPPEHDIPADFPDRVDKALEALWGGDSTEFEGLLDFEDATHPGLGQLLDGVISKPAGPLVGLGIPSQVGGYKIIRQIGRGGMGVVYEAQQQDPPRPVALKVLAAPWADEHHVKLFRREVETLARLNHPAIATIYEAGRTQEGQHFFAMELLRGVPLNAYVREKQVSRRQRLELVLKICEAIHYAHQWVIHRDLKPSNIFIDEAGNPKILDFGLARIIDAELTLTISATEIGKIVGTLAYMSPEQAGGKSEQIDARTDVYSLGMILYELLTGRLPHELPTTSAQEALQVIREQSPRKPSTFDRTLRGELETIVLKSLQKDPAERYQSAKELADDIRRYLQGEPIRARPPSALYVVRKKVRKHRVAVTVVATLLTLGAGGLWGEVRLTHYWHQRDREAELRLAQREILAAQRDVEMGRWEDVLENARAWVERYPELPEARLVLAQALYRAGRRGQDTEARSRIHKAMEVLRGELKNNLWLSSPLLEEIYRASGNREAAERLQLYRRGPEPDAAKHWYVRSFATLETQKALNYVRQALDREPGYALARERLAHLCMVSGDLDGALTAADKLIDLVPDCVWPRLLKAHVLARKGQYLEAIAEYTGVIRRRPTLPSPYRCRATVYLCLKQYEKADADYTRAWKRRPADRWSYHHQATARQALGQPAKAAISLENFRQRHSVPSYAHARLFFILTEQGNQHGAKELLSDIRSAVTAGWLSTIFACLDGEKTPEQLADDADPSNAEQVCQACYYAGEMCRLNGQDSEARQWFQRCVDTGLVLDPNSFPLDPMNEYHLAVWWLDHLPAEDSAACRPATRQAAATDLR